MLRFKRHNVYQNEFLYFHVGKNEEFCFLGNYVVWLFKDQRFRGTYRLQLQGERTL
jgi:hypothetical protein